MFKVLIVLFVFLASGKTWKINEFKRALDNLQTLNDYVDYVDDWSSKRQKCSAKDNIVKGKAACTVTINSLTEPQPVYELGTNLKNPSDTSGNLVFADSETIKVSCIGKKNGLTHPSATERPVEATVTCVGGTYFSSTTWLPGGANLPDMKCLEHVPSFETITSTPCARGQGIKIDVGIQSASRTYVTFTSCFKKETAEVLFVEYDQNLENQRSQPNVGRLNYFQKGQWETAMLPETLYKKVSQKETIAYIVGSELIDKYVSDNVYLVKGHLAAKADFVLAPSQRATFTFTNVAPQWLSFNNGNWRTLEQALRKRIGETKSRTRIYTGTWDILTLKDCDDVEREIHLVPGTKMIPVPLWFYKVVHEPKTNKATAFLGLNNPHVTLQEAKNLAFCTDVCNGKKNFNWLKWKPENLRNGFSICCDVNDFKKTVNHLPEFPIYGLFD